MFLTVKLWWISVHPKYIIWKILTLCSLCVRDTISIVHTKYLLTPRQICITNKKQLCEFCVEDHKIIDERLWLYCKLPLDEVVFKAAGRWFQALIKRQLYTTSPEPKLLCSWLLNIEDPSVANEVVAGFYAFCFVFLMSFGYHQVTRSHEADYLKFKST